MDGGRKEILEDTAIGKREKGVGGRNPRRRKKK